MEKEKTTLRTTLKVFSIIAMVIGGLAIVESVTMPGSDSGYALLGGLLFVAEGWLALAYIVKKQ